MRAILTLLVLVVVASSAAAQKPPINGVAGPTTADQFYSINPDVRLRRYSEEVIDPAPTITANVLTVDLALGNIAVIQNNADISTFNITNALASGVPSFTMYFVSDGNAHSQTWGGQIKWSNAAPPVFSATLGKVDLVWCSTPDQGTYYCSFLRNF